MSKRTRIVLKSGKDVSLLRYHPWIFSGAIKKIYGEPAEGDEVRRCTITRIISWRSDTTSQGP
ncbi:MAG: hypothetical protein R2744_04045 [Bacteroidales bacterium]